MKVFSYLNNKKFNSKIIGIFYLLFIILNKGTEEVNCIKIKNKNKLRIEPQVVNIYDDPEYGDDLEGISLPKLKLDKEEKDKKKKKQISLFSKIYEKINPLDVLANSANLLKDNEDTNKSFRKLNAIANMKGGKDALKKDVALKGILLLLLNDPSKSINARTKAAQLSARIYDLPTTYQFTEPDQKNAPKNVDSYIAVPRVQRIYRPDYYIENYKAGNWEP